MTLAAGSIVKLDENSEAFVVFLHPWLQHPPPARYVFQGSDKAPNWLSTATRLSTVRSIDR